MTFHVTMRTRGDDSGPNPFPRPVPSVDFLDVTDDRTSTLVGQNAWLVDEMYEQYREDPDLVSPAWQEFFEDYRGRADAGAPMPPASGPRSEAESAAPLPAVRALP